MVVVVAVFEVVVVKVIVTVFVRDWGLYTPKVANNSIVT